MGACRHVIRVGSWGPVGRWGWAVALGLGTAVFSVGGVASADSGTDGSQPSGRSGRTAQSSAPSVESRSNSGNNSRPTGASKAKVRTAPLAASPRKVAVPPAAGSPAAPRSAASVLSGGAASNAALSSPDLDSPVLAVLVGLSRRRHPGAGQVASAVTRNGVTVDPGVTYLDGVIQGNLNAVSASGDELVYEFLGESKFDDKLGRANPGKLDIAENNAADTAQVVPKDLDPFLPPDAKGGDGSFSVLPYATWLDPDSPTQNPTPTGTQMFDVRVTENTDFDKFVAKIPLVGQFVSPIIGLLQQTPFMSTLLAPIIGGSVVAEIAVSLDDLVPAGSPVAFTYLVTSFDGTLISTNFFPASILSLGPDNRAATLLNGPGLSAPGQTDPYAPTQTKGSTPGLPIMRGQVLPGSGFNVITWDPRGEFRSGGTLQFDNPFYEGRDVSAILDWAAANTPFQSTEGALDVGMIGASYGGAIQLATVDPRIEAIVPTAAWNSLNDSLYPDQVPKTVDIGLIVLGIVSGDPFGWIGRTGQARLGSSGPTSLLTKLAAPTLHIQGITDSEFPLQQSIVNAQTQLEQNPYFDGPNTDQVKMIWFCGGHGVCLDPVDLTAQRQELFTASMNWLNTYVKDLPLPGPPTFQWWDQVGTHFASGLLPFDPAFVVGDVSGTTSGGRVPILPFAIGGSGPNRGKPTDPNCVQEACKFGLNMTIATEAKLALNVSIPVQDAGTEIVGAPTVTFTYSGLGNAAAVYGQIVDDATGRVLGNLVTPIPVALDGRTHTVTASLADIVYTSQNAGDTLTLQIVGSSTIFLNGKFGTVKISDLSVDLPVTLSGRPV